jgi:putative glutamine amidotransferase
MRRPLIGVTTYHRLRVAPAGRSASREGGPGPLPLLADRAHFHVPASYVDAVRASGGRPVLLPPGDEDPAALVDELDGVLLCGGGDIDPGLFGGPSGHEAQYSTCPERDAFELALVRECLARATPMLAICRGLQVLNVALGGDLHVHLPDVVGEKVPHRLSRERPTRHPVRVAPGSRLAGLLGPGELVVASWHHQAVDRLGRGLRAVAWAEDTTVEAVELEGRPELLAVQWHPELQMEEPDGRHRRLFERLVSLAREQG